MVNGKPTFVFGDDSRAVLQPKARPTARNAARNSLAPAPEFASFLPGGGRSQPAGVPGGSMPASFTTHSTQGVHADLTAALRQGVGMGQGGSDGLLSGSDAIVVHDAVKASSPAPSSSERNLTASGLTRAQAGVQVQEAMQRRGVATGAGRSSFDAAAAGASRKPVRVSSGTPVTGRNSIGMEDTRRTRSAGGSTLTRHEDFSAPTAAALQAQGAFGPQGPQGQNGAPQGTFNQGGMPAVAPQGNAFLFQGLGGMGLSAQMGASSPQGYSYNLTGQNDPRNMAALARALENSDKPLKTLNSLPGGLAYGAARGVQFPSREEGAIMAVRTAANRGSGLQGVPVLPENAGKPLARALQSVGPETGMMVGTLAAKFESGSDGIAAIGYDRHGGTSYGKFQLSSRAGTMGNFVRYLEDKAPDMAKKLAAAGPANTGRRTGKMPEVWRDIAAAEPQRFEGLQDDFIRKSHFEPALQGIAESTGLAFDQMPPALQEVVFSTAVQHGPAGAARIVAKAVSRVGAGKIQQAQDSPENFKRTGRDLIKHIYSIRAGQFVSSTERVQAAAKSRLNNEMREALGMLA